MKDVKDKVAVVTGAASGIGRGMAETFVAAGMKVVLSDIESDALDQTIRSLREAGADVLAMRTDVSKPEQVDELARQTLKKYGAVHVLCNNAGIATGVGGGASWKSSLNDWHWILGVNLMGVVHGIRSFLPVMIEQDTEAHIVNTASLAGLIPSSALYGTTKFAVVGLSESTYLELQRGGYKPKMSVLCPGFVDTNIIDSERNRPAEFTDQSPRQAPPDEAFRKSFSELLKNSLSPREVGKHVLAAIREERFYILTHPEWNPLIEQRMKDILSGNNPTLRPLPGAELRAQSAPQAN
ncbi:MAG: SDR family NAD(P)-dependent oxidoreductase [Steroidobacteraceae bacterium]